MGHPGLWNRRLALSVRSAEWILVSRFIQAFGASTGSVVTQTILRESIDGAKRHAVFAQISARLRLRLLLGRSLAAGWINLLASEQCS